MLLVLLVNKRASFNSDLLCSSAIEYERRQNKYNVKRNRHLMSMQH